MSIDVFYPIVPNLDWLWRIVPLGVRTVQLRIKDEAEADVASQIIKALDITRAHGCQLVVNDFWQEAIAAGADYIHLGQEDLARADLGAIRDAGMRLGISTHTREELEVALSAEPDYIALGPIYETKLKAMPWAPQGLDRVREWSGRIGPLPLIAIGGIAPERAGAVLDAGADSVAVITDFVTAPHPEARIRLWLDWADSIRR